MDDAVPLWETVSDWKFHNIVLSMALNRFNGSRTQQDASLSGGRGALIAAQRFQHVDR